jgi:hypothetical protein
MINEKLSVVGILVVAALAGAPTSYASSSPRAVAEVYFDATTTSDLDAASQLFARQSSVYETGGVEGSWEHYREHHLAPEIDAIKSFKLSKKEPEIMRSDDGSLAFVAWPIEYTIVLEDERVINSKGTVTFLLVREDGQYKIRQLHWSSRRKP